MSDEFDLASEREIEEREYRIAEARRPENQQHPVLDCQDCSGIDQDTAKIACQHFADCVSDWQRIVVSKKLNGNGCSDA